ncbi:hypothetical protein DXC11_04110 [Firmicutes bacterium OM08-11AC]|jgi:hypothetical protein|nr:hypothetical protein DXC11_04110 [Firmicutes bacterium OM08-11AC]
MEMNKRETKVTWLDVILALLAGTVIVAGILCIAQTIWSGYHFLDDHELFRIEQSANQGQPLLTTVKAWILNDLRVRYRPLYWTERVTVGYLFGSNLTAWNIWTAVKGVFSFALLYLTARFLKNTRLISFVFPMIIMLGAQFTPWYRSANQESTGLLLCSAILCLITAQYNHRKFTSVAYNVPIVILVVLSGLVKESFTLFMPVFPALKLWLEYWDGCDASWMGTSRKGRLLRMIRKNLVVYLCILVAFLFNVYMILFRVGVDQISYAGFHKDTNLGQYLYGISNSLFQNMKWNTLIAGLLLLMMLLCYQLIEKYNIRKYLSLCAILVCAMVLQLVAHARSQMWERYLFPYIIAYALLFVLLGYHIFEKDKFRRKIYFAVLLALLGMTVPTAARSARDYAKDGEWTREYFQCILENTTSEDRIVAALADGEVDLSTERWLEAHGRSQVFSFVGEEWKNMDQLGEALTGECSWENVKVITCYSYAQIYTLSFVDGVSEDDFDTYTFGNYMVMVRK